MNLELLKQLELAIKAFKKGEMLIVVDDESRENEGDLVIAAQYCTLQQMAVMIRYTSGIICAPLTSNVAKRLNLLPMVQQNNAPHGTAFTVSVDAKLGTTTGISAADRIATAHLLSDPASTECNFVRPGHLFPLISSDLGVLGRAGHTEAAVDLCQLSGLEPVALIGELMNDDGTVMRRSDIENFSKKHHYRLIRIAELVAYRKHLRS